MQIDNEIRGKIKYRVTVWRLPLTEDERLADSLSKILVSNMVKKIGNERAVKAHEDYEKSTPEGFILKDFIFDSEKSDLTGQFFMDNYIKKEHPEATLASWDIF